MEGRDVIATLREWESRYPVEDWHVDGIHIWPHLRVKMGAKMIAASSTRSRSSAPSKLERWVELAGSAAACARDARSVVRHIPRANAVFLGYPIARHRLGRKWYDSHFDPMADFLEQHSLSTLQLEYRLDRVSYRVPRHRPALLIRPSVYTRTKADKRGLPDYELNLEGYDDLAATARDELRASGAPDSVRFPKRWRLVDRVRAINQIADYFETVFDRAQPEVALCTAYYSIVNMAFCLAAARRGIRSVDVQHGVTWLNPAYDGWTRFPKTGYELLPDFFWCWTEKDGQPVSGWPSHAHDHHRVLIGGQPWATYWQQDREFTSAFRRQLADIKGASRNILVALSWSSGLTPTHREVIRESPEDWAWWIRLHPTMESQRNEIRNLCEELAPGRAHVDLPTDLPLPLLLQEADAHLTAASSVIQEATAWGLPSVAIEQRAAELYEPEFAAGWVRCAENPREILTALEEQIRSSAGLERAGAYPPMERMGETLLALIGASGHELPGKGGARA